MYPASSFPRFEAGEPLQSRTMQCQFRPVDAADYAGYATRNPAWTGGARDTDLAKLRTVFPDGVCDYTKPGLEEQPLAGTWIQVTGVNQMKVGHPLSKQPRAAVGGKHAAHPAAVSPSGTRAAGARRCAVERTLAVPGPRNGWIAPTARGVVRHCATNNVSLDSGDGRRKPVTNNDRSTSGESWFDRDADYRLMIESITDYAIFFLDPTASCSAGTRARGSSRATNPTRSSGAISPSSIRPSCWRRTGRSTNSKSPRTGQYEEEGWRLRKDGTRIWSSHRAHPPHEPGRHAARLFQDHPRPVGSPEAGRAAARQRGALPADRRWREGLRDLHARPQRLHRELEHRREGHQGLRGARDHRQALLGVLSARGVCHRVSRRPS
jgi:hypothetical protein